MVMKSPSHVLAVVFAYIGVFPQKLTFSVCPWGGRLTRYRIGRESQLWAVKNHYDIILYIH